MVVKQVVIEREGKHYFVSTVLPSFGPRIFETMVFSCTPDGQVTDWSEIHVKHYNNEIDAINGHNEVQFYWHPNTPL